MMSMVRTIDRYLYSLFQKLPHLSTSYKLAFAKDLWVAAVLFLILYTLQLLGYLGFLASLLLGEASPLRATFAVPIEVIGTPVEELGISVVVVYTIYLALIVGLLIRSIKPLKNGYREGWLYFLAVVLLVLVGSIVSATVGVLATQQIITSLVVAAMLVYILYEVRQEFKI